MDKSDLKKLRRVLGVINSVKENSDDCIDYFILNGISRDLSVFIKDSE